MSNIWVTSDTHYGHINIVRGTSNWENKSSCRDFDTVEEMNDKLVQNINEVVKKEDILFHLGDWSLAGRQNIGEFRRKLNCQDIHLILGNHDTVLWNRDSFEKDWFSSVKGLDLIKLNHIQITLCHFALRTWYHQARGAWMLHGHSHGNLPDFKVGKDIAKTMDVGIDTHPEFRPYSFDEIKQIMDQRVNTNSEENAEHRKIR